MKAVIERAYLADSGTTKGVKMARHSGAEVTMAKSFQSAM